MKKTASPSRGGATLPRAMKQKMKRKMKHKTKRSVPNPDSTRERILTATRRVPRGKVATYGQIAELAGLPGHARQVGYALAAIGKSSTVPWHRIIDAQGRLSMRSSGVGSTIIQQHMLEREGVAFDDGGRVSLRRFRWTPRGR